MTSADTIITQIGTVKPHVRPVVDEIANRFGPLYFVWGYANKPGEHGQGLALDFGIKDKGTGAQSTWLSRPGPERHALGEQIADYCWRNRARLNIWYVIWNRRIISITYPNDGWRPYSGASAHTDHVHVSFKSTGTYRPPTDQPDTQSEDDMPTLDQVFNTKMIPNRNAPGDDSTGKTTLAGVLSNLEATQDTDHALLVKVSAQLGAVNGAVAQLAKALAAQADSDVLDADALVAAVRKAAEDGANAALASGVVDVDVTVRDQTGGTAA